MASAIQAPAVDWPCYRGPGHDGVSTDPILTDFPPEGPPQVWRVPLGAAFSSFAVSGGRAFTQVRRTIGTQDSEVCIALNAANGAELWATSVDIASYPDGAAGSDDGPRSTPCVDGAAVYVLSSYLKLTKLNAADGAVLWQKDLCALYGGVVIPWQNAASPLIEGDFIYVNCNSDTNSLLALRKTDGGLVWRHGTGAHLTHATPVPATILGTRQILFLAQEGVVAVAPDSGDELWRYPFPFETFTAVSPVVAGDIIYCSGNYTVGGGAARISQSGGQFVITQLWLNPTLRNSWSTAIVSQGYIYGLFGSTPTASLKCLDLQTGSVMWSAPGFGRGGVLLVDGKLLVTDEQGSAVLVELFPRTYNELARFPAAAGTCWNSAAICNGRLYARSTTEAVCLNLAPANPAPDLVQRIERLAGGQYCLRIAAADNSPIDPVLVPLLEVRAATNLSTTFSTWPILTNSLILTNGLIEMPLDTASRQRFFITVRPQ